MPIKYTHLTQRIHLKAWKLYHTYSLITPYPNRVMGNIVCYLNSIPLSMDTTYQWSLRHPYTPKYNGPTNLKQGVGRDNIIDTKTPCNLPICYAKSTWCQNRTYEGIEPLSHLTTHFVTKILSCSTTPINPNPPSSLGMVKTFQETKRRPITPACLNQKDDLKILSSWQKCTLLWNQ